MNETATGSGCSEFAITIVILALCFVGLVASPLLMAYLSGP